MAVDGGAAFADQGGSGYEDASDDTIESGGRLIDLRSMWLILRRRLRIFLLVAAFVAIIGIVVTFVLADNYTATSTVLIDRRTTDVATADAVLSGLPQDSASVDTEVKVLTSPALLTKVVQNLKLGKDSEFNGEASAGGIGSTIRGWFPAASGGQKKTLDEIAEANLEDAIVIKRTGLTYAIDISVTTLEPRKSALIANAIAAEYLQRQVDEKRLAATSAQKYLNSRLSGLGAEVQGRETQAQALRARSGLSVIPDATNVATYDQQVILDLTRQSVELQSDLAEKRGRLAAARAAGRDPSALPSVLESNVIRDLKARRADALAKSADIANRYGPLYPDTVRSKAELSGIDSQISREMASLTASLNQEVDVAQQRLGIIQDQIARQQGKAVSNSQNTARVSQIEREALASRGVYEDFLKRSKETAQTEDLAKPDAAIVSLANAPAKPSSPNRPLLAIASLLAAGVMGVLAVIFAELIDIKLSSATDVQRYLGLKRIGSIPEVKGTDSQSALIVEKPFSSYAEAFRNLTDNLDRVEGGTVKAGPRVTMVSSALPHEGKTTVAISLALSLVKTGQRVLLVDADLRRPQVMQSIRMGVSETSAGAGQVEGQEIHNAGQNFDVLPLNGPNVNVEMFRDGSFAKLLAALRPRYDHIVVDTPPVLALSDAKHIAHFVDSVIFVTRWRKTSRFAARTAVQALRDANAKFAGVVLNAVDWKVQSLYGRDDALGFYGSYKAYYTE